MNATTRPDIQPGGLEDLFEGACIVDQGLTLLQWNHAAEAITGYSSAEVVGERCRDDLLLAVDPATASVRSVTNLLAETLRDSGHREIDAYLRHKDGSYVPARVRIAPFRDASGRHQVAAYIFSRELALGPLARQGPEEVGEARLDPLTGVANRKLIEMHVRLRLSEMYRHGWGFGVILVWVRGLQELAANHGPASADQALVAVARTLANRMDPQDILGRWRNDAFLALCRRITREQLEELADTFRALVGAASCPPTRDDHRLGVTAGAALAVPGCTLDSLLRRVEEFAAADQRAAG
ncbi:MAG: sensor domain-containing diguanylate cyclase [Acidobacteria bacterium]|nr:sensor domain-containing diguanylate cyclase [Acidobacteriota bacterium]